MDISADSLIISVSRSNPDTIFNLTKDLERGRFGNLIEEWSLSNSTLEEVFMQLTDKKNQLNL